MYLLVSIGYLFQDLGCNDIVFEKMTFHFLDCRRLYTRIAIQYLDCKALQIFKISGNSWKMFTF